MKETTTPEAVLLSDYRPSAFLLDQTRLNFILGDQSTRVESTLSLRRRAGTECEPLVLDGEHLKLISVALNSVPMAPRDYRLDGRGLHLADLPDAFKLSVVTEIEPQHNTALEGLYRSGGNHCTQCEAEGFRRITYYPDRPDVMATFRVRIEADKTRYPVLLSNGNPIARGDLGARRHFVTWDDPHPKPSYLFALVAGDLTCIEDTYVTASGREVALCIYVEKHNADQCAHAMRSLKKAMHWDEQVYGLEYDLDIYMIVAVDDFNMGAMENKGLNIFNSKFVLADQKTATDTDFQDIESVIAHEYFHNWTGNRVTCRDWFQLSLKEGLTVFRDQQFSADMNSPAVKRIEDVRLLRTHQFPEDAGPTAHPVQPDSYIEINNFYTLTVYEKGAEIIRMLHTLLGPDQFRDGMDLYFARHDGQAVTCDDFVGAMEGAGDVDLTVFKRWYVQAGTPELQVSMHYDAVHKTCTLDFVQSTPPTPDQTEKRPVHIPMRMSLLGADGAAIALYSSGLGGAGGATECVIELLDRHHSVTFGQIDAPPVPSLLRGFSAPVKLSFDYSDTQLAFLMAHDDDAFNRWDASQQWALRVAVQWIEAKRAHRVSPSPQVWLDACRALLMSDIDQALLAEILDPPEEEMIGESFRQMDMPELFAAREWMLSELADALQPELLSIYWRCHSDAAFALDASAIGRRRLKNTCLALLARCADRSGVEMAIVQYSEATGMSDEIAALKVLCDADAIDQQPYLDSFYAKWRDQRLVIDKWFSLQAMSTRPDTLQRVRELTGHPDFDLLNPNRARALLAAFAIGNPVRFHAVDGAGYALLSDYVIELDSINPQIAACLVASMSHWRRYTDANRRQMQRQLQRILSKEGLSNDVYELVEKSLR